MSKARIEWLDLFRGIAAIFVVGYHYRYYLGAPRLSFGFVAVDLFFVLSGIVLGQRYTRSIEEGMSFGRFAAIRLIRLYPLTFLAGLFVVAMNLAGVPTGYMVASADYGAWTLFTLTPMLSPTPFPPDGPVWSLWAEFVTNAIWFFALKRGRRLVAIVGAMAVIATIVVAILNGSLDFGFGPGLRALAGAAVRAMAGFSIGLLIASRPWRNGVSPALLIALLGSLCIAYPSYPGWIISLATVAVGALLLASLAAASAPSYWLGRVSRWMGMASFPIYLIHAPAGRLLPLAPRGVPHVVVVLVLIGLPSLIATIMNESIVGYLQRRFRQRPGPNLSGCQLER